MRISRRTTCRCGRSRSLYLALLLLLPLGVVFCRTFEHGFGVAWNWVTTPAAISALWLSLLIAAIAVPLNTIFGVGMRAGAGRAARRAGAGCSTR